MKTMKLEEDVRRYRIHFNDECGNAAIEVYADEYDEVMANLKADPEVDGIWVETYDDEEGWQA